MRRLLNYAEQFRYAMEYRRRLGEIMARLPQARQYPLSYAARQEIRNYWRGYGINRVNLNWYRLYGALLGNSDPRMVPEEIFRVFIEPRLCRRDVASAYHDKNQLDKLFPEAARPAVVLRNIYGRYFDGDYALLSGSRLTDYLASIPGQYFLKPAISGTGSGHNVAKVVLNTRGFGVGQHWYTLAELEAIYVQDFLLQKPVRQHALLAAFHPASLNTIRIISLRFRDDLVPIAATFRMGNGSHVDNGHAGGLLCGVALDSGRLTSFAYNVMFQKFDRHPITGALFAGFVMPMFDQIKALAATLHGRLAYFDVVSFDIAIGEDGKPWLIEVNTFGQGVEPHQILKGGPLFGEYTDRVLELVKQRIESGWNA